MSKASVTSSGTAVDERSFLLDDIFSSRYDIVDPLTGAVTETDFKKTIRYLAELRPPRSMPGKPYKDGVMGFRRNGRNINITIACGRAIVRQLELSKFVVMLEKMHDDPVDAEGNHHGDRGGATIVLENFSDADEYKASRGQLLGRFNPVYSCFTIAQGLTGRVIHGPQDVVRMDAYYFNKDILTAFYITSKLQLGVEDKLSELISAYDGWKVFDLPLDPCNPDEG